MTHTTETVRDVLAWFPGAMQAETSGCNTLILWRLDDSFQRFDGQRARFQLTWWWHQKPPEGDPHGSVQGDEYSYWTEKEIRELKLPGGQSLFSAFHLF